MSILKDVKKFVNAGNAIFTIKNENTGNRFTYRIYKKKDSKVSFVSVLNGSDNESSYRYLGTIFDNNSFRITKKSTITPKAQSAQAFNWFWKNINTLPDNIKVYHEGRCGKCGRKLTVPESIKSGFGSTCIGKI